MITEYEMVTSWIVPALQGWLSYVKSEPLRAVVLEAISKMSELYPPEENQ